MQHVHVSEAAKQLPNLIDAAVRGEVILVINDEHRTVRLVPINHAKHPRRAGSAKGLIRLADDFHTPLEDFREYVL